MIEAIADAVAAREFDPLRAERDQLTLVLGFTMTGRRSEVTARTPAPALWSWPAPVGDIGRARPARTNHDEVGQAAVCPTFDLG